MSETTNGVTPETLWLADFAGTNDEAKKETNILFEEGDYFDTPKPERLIQRVLTIATNPGDLVMDSFLGSGTTAAVAHKMGLQWIGIEMGDHAKTHCAVRLKKVVDGEQGGISAAVGWNGGGGFRYYELGEAILQPDGTLTENIPFETMAAHVWFTETERPYDRPAKKTTVLGVSFAETTNIGLDLENGFVFDEHVYDGLLKTYHGIFEFSKHFLGPHRVPAFDGTGVGGEFECAKQIDSHPQVDCWLRNIANHPRSFRLPIATEKSDWFYPDFVGQLKDGRMFVFEYKGDMTAQLRETSEKDAIGKLWAAQDRSMYVYATIYKSKDGKSVAQQIDAAFSLA